MSNLYWFDQIQPEHRSLVGSKAFHLAHLLQAGHPVVPGFVISAQILHKFLATMDWLEPLFADLPYSSLRLDIENPQQLQAIAQRIRQAIEAATLSSDEWLVDLKAAVEQLDSPVVVLRPSLALKAPIRSRSHHFEPVILGKSSALFDIQICDTTEEALTQGVKRLWADLFGAKSLFYWQKSEIPLQQVRLAVLVQPLWSAIAAGTVQANEAYFNIQSTPGLGVAIAWGEVSPDVYQVHTSSGTILSRSLGTKTIAYQPGTRPTDRNLWLQSRLLTTDQQFSYALDSQQLDHLIQLVQRLIADLGTPLEFEWTLCSQTNSQPLFYLTQVIPGLSPASRLEIGEPPAPLNRISAPMNSSSTLLLSGLAVSQGHAIARARVITNPNEAPVDVIPGTVLVADVLMPQWLPWIKQSAAIITEQGSITSHSAIIAREVGVPAVMGTARATQLIQTGDLVMVDGEQGKVYRIESATMVPEAERRSTQLQSTQPESAQPPKDPSSPPHLPAPKDIDLHPVSVDSPSDRPPIGTRLMVNLSQPDSLARLTNLPVDGVGLLRSELLILDFLENQHPDQWLRQGRSAELAERLTHTLNQFAATLAPRPVFYRSLDLRSHEFRGMEGGESVPVEVNPMLGMRGTFSYVKHPALFELELVALAGVQRAGYTNIRLMLPFVRTVEEFCFCRQRAELAGLTYDPGFQIWIMAEVPSVLFLLPEYVKAGVKGISIGSNDLTQLLLGVDRDYAPMADAFDERHPAVKAAIAQLIRQANQLGIPCALCGEAPTRYPELVEDLIRWGIDTLSVDLDAVETTYWAIARAERRLLLEAARQQ